MGDLDCGRVAKPAIPHLTEENIRDAQLAVAHGARDVEDCRLLLDALGLLPGQPAPRSSRLPPKMLRGSDDA